MKCICKKNFSVNQDFYFKEGDIFEVTISEIKTDTFYYKGYVIHTGNWLSPSTEETYPFNSESFEKKFSIIKEYECILPFENFEKGKTYNFISNIE